MCVLSSMELVRGFGMFLRAAGRRPIPVDRQLRTLQHYLRHCNGNAPLERAAILAYLEGCAASVKRITLRNRWDVLHAFCRYAVAEGLVAADPMAGLPRPRVAREETERDVEPVTPAMLVALLAVCPTWTWIGQRDRAIVRMLWETPLRASELCGLLVMDIDWDAMEVRVRDGKGGSRYEALITEDLGLALARYLRNRRHDCGALFVSKDGCALSPHALGQLLQRLSRRAAIAPHVFPHQFRHTFRVRMRALGLDDCDVSALMGHRSVVPTWGYGRRQARSMAKARLRERLAG